MKKYQEVKIPDAIISFSFLKKSYKSPGSFKDDKKNLYKDYSAVNSYIQRGVYKVM